MSDEELPRYRVEFTDRGRKEYEEAALWYLGQSPETAGAWLDGFEEAIRSLETLPGVHPIAPESSHFDRTIRRLLYRKFRVLFFVVEGEEDEAGTAWIAAVRHGAARPMGQEEDDGR